MFLINNGKSHMFGYIIFFSLFRKKKSLNHSQVQTLNQGTVVTQDTFHLPIIHALKANF